jgi:hypothetical protein
MSQDEEANTGGVAPEEFLAALLAIKSEDAKDVREKADVKAKPDARRPKRTGRKEASGQEKSKQE